MPTMPEKAYIKRILPPAYQKDHWQDRLGIDFGEGCYEEISKKVLRKINNLLEDNKWSKTELWMLETLKKSESEMPDWVSEIKPKTE
jgi:hypothetical protein